MTPFNVLETSGHVEKFTDLMVSSSRAEVRNDASKTKHNNLRHVNYYHVSCHECKVQLSRVHYANSSCVNLGEGFGDRRTLSSR